MNIACPHCGTANAESATFCASCGKALPTMSPAGPQILSGGAMPTSSAGHNVYSGELQKQAKKAFGALLAVGILQLVFGAVIVFALQNSPQVGEIPMTVYLMVFGIGIVFLGLAFWARSNPLPPAIIGLVLFITVHLLDALQDPSALVRGILIKIIIIVVLVQAISAGLKHRQLQAQAPRL